MARPSKHVSLIIKGPMKSARRAAQRYNLNTRDCVDVSAASGHASQRGDIQCYVPCSPTTNRKVVDWYTERNRIKHGRGFPAGTLLYHGGLCETNFGRRRSKRRRASR